MDGLKVAIIGGGSSYTPEIIEGLIKKQATFPLTELVLFDLPEAINKLTTMAELSKRMFKRAKIDVKVEHTTDRKAALLNAHYVLSQFRAGGLNARILDEKIPLKHGVIGQETVGPGGFAKALRTIPVTLDLCKDMETYCPNAWLVNFTNPSGMVTEAVINHTSISTVGLCNVPIGLKFLSARLLNVDAEEVSIDYIGLNHLVWGESVYLNGEEVTEKVLELMANATPSMKNIQGAKWDPVFLKSLGMVPCDYHRYYYLTDEMYQIEKEQASLKGTRGEIVKKLDEELFTIYNQPNLDEKPDQLSQRGGAYYSVAAINLIDSIHNDRKDIQPVNVRNNGAISNLPDHVVIETNAIIGKKVLKPLATGKAPLKISGLLQAVKAYEELTIQAAITGDYHTALQALCANPLVHSANAAKNVLDELLEAHKEYLPQYCNG
ncbi:6-phospho-beta-glucosidase [Pseudalkalibacillus hwajinpoensis]|uniref:6-phospho-beta-glucosidase n=1 Tax=Guptibacillus hwajinpoensis TaxID=208199 RepID=UPI001CFF24FB